MRFAARRDPNHKEIRDGLARVPGCSVYDSSWIGGGMPDLVCLFRARFLFLEIKDPTKPPSARKLKPSQEKMRERFAPVYRVVTTLEEAMRELGIT